MILRRLYTVVFVFIEIQSSSLLECAELYKIHGNKKRYTLVGHTIEKITKNKINLRNSSNDIYEYKRVKFLGAIAFMELKKLDKSKYNKRITEIFYYTVFYPLFLNQFTLEKLNENLCSTCTNPEERDDFLTFLLSFHPTTTRTSDQITPAYIDQEHKEEDREVENKPHIRSCNSSRDLINRTLVNDNYEINPVHEIKIFKSNDENYAIRFKGPIVSQADIFLTTLTQFILTKTNKELENFNKDHKEE